jgi:hypothetical protein
MSASEDEWLDGMEEFLVEDDNPDTWIHFVTYDTPDYIFEHWQNIYESETQEYFADVGSYIEDEV